MRREDLDVLWMWLKASYPKKYKAMSDQEVVLIKDNISFAYEKCELDEVMTAYRFFLDKSPFEPTTAEVKTYIAERLVKVEAPVEIDGLPEHHYMRGRYLHSEAFDKAQADFRSGIRRPFKWYIEKYPAIEWVPWVAGPPEYWKGIEYKGWERTRDGEIKPIGAPNKRDLTITQIGRL